MVEKQTRMAAFGGNIKLLKELTEKDWEEAKRKALEAMAIHNQGLATEKR
jgi:hypothetical protein